MANARAPFPFPTRRAVAAGLAMMLATPRTSTAAAYTAPARTLTVTTLADGGPGSLREAVATRHPARIAFAVAGTIAMERDIVVRTDGVWIDGEDAPAPGITLRGAALRVKGSGVVVRHLRVRVGDGAGPKPENRDGIAVEGWRSGRPVSGVTIENCSVSWSIDEGISIFGPAITGVTVRRCIVAEPLNRSLHPKGQHGMALLAGRGVQDVLMQENLIIHGMWRNPVVAGGASAIVVNNLIVNPGRQAIHFYPHTDYGPTRAAVVGNVVLPGADTRVRNTPWPRGLNTGSMIHWRDNVFDGRAWEPALPAGTEAPSPPLWRPDLVALDAGDVRARVLELAGARPRDRDATDRRLTAEALHRAGRILDRPPPEEFVQ